MARRARLGRNRCVTEWPRAWRTPQSYSLGRARHCFRCCRSGTTAATTPCGYDRRDFYLQAIPEWVAASIVVVADPYMPPLRRTPSRPVSQSRGSRTPRLERSGNLRTRCRVARRRSVPSCPPRGARGWQWHPLARPIIRRPRNANTPASRNIHGVFPTTGTRVAFRSARAPERRSHAGGTGGRCSTR